MRYFFTVLAALGASLGVAHAQSGGLDVDLVLDNSVFLPGEEIPVGVRISNLSGRPLTFGSTNNWLTFFAETKGGAIVDRLGLVPVEGEFTLESAKAGTKWWNLQPWFDLDDPGQYLLYAELRVPEWNERWVSAPATITVQPARKLWEVTFGVPPAPGQPAGPPEIRRYALQAATRMNERKLFARVTDEAENRIFRVVTLDHLLSFSHPVQQLDDASRLHVLFQTGGNTYTYCVVDTSGELTLRQRHEITPGSRPRLAKAADGSINVRGGQRLPNLTDIPPYAPPFELLTPTNAAQAATNSAPAAADSKTSKSKKRRKSTE